MDWHNQNEIRETTFNADRALSTFKTWEHSRICIRDQPNYKYDKMLKIHEQKMSWMSTTIELLIPCQDGTNVLMWLMTVLKNIDTLFK
jgi:hypothetical protein